MLANGDPIHLTLEGDEERCAAYLPVARAMLEKLYRIDPGATFQDVQQFEDGQVSVTVRRVGQVQTARIRVEEKEEVPQIGIGILEGPFKNSMPDPIKRSLFEVFKPKKQPPGTPTGYGVYGFSIRKELDQRNDWFDSAHNVRYPWGEFYRKDEVWVCKDGVAYKAKVSKAKDLDPAYPAGHSLSANAYSFTPQFNLPVHEGALFLGIFMHPPVPVKRGFWYCALTGVDFLQESDIKEGGMERPVDMVDYAELLSYTKQKDSLTRTVLQKSSGLYVYHNFYGMPYDNAITLGWWGIAAKLAANEDSLFLVAAYFPGDIGDPDPDFAVPYLASKVFVSRANKAVGDTSSYVYNTQVLFMPSVDFPEETSLVREWEVCSAWATGQYLYISLFRWEVYPGELAVRFPNKLLIVRASNLQFVQLIDNMGGIQFKVSDAGDKVAVAIKSRIVYLDASPNKGAIYDLLVYSVSIAGNGQHTFTKKHESKLSDTTPTGTGTGNVYNGEQYDHFVANISINTSK